MSQLKEAQAGDRHPTRRSCCYCSAAPAFTIIIASKSLVRHAVDVLLCEQHYQQCAPALTRLTPLVFDSDGYIVATAPRS